MSSPDKLVLQTNVDIGPRAALAELVQAWARTTPAGVPNGPLTATALVASIGDAKNVDNGRRLARRGPDAALHWRQCHTARHEQAR
jgi:hypothetical protein